MPLRQSTLYLYFLKELIYKTCLTKYTIILWFYLRNIHSRLLPTFFYPFWYQTYFQERSAIYVCVLLTYKWDKTRFWCKLFTKTYLMSQKCTSPYDTIFKRISNWTPALQRFIFLPHFIIILQKRKERKISAEAHSVEIIEIHSHNFVTKIS